MAEVYDGFISYSHAADGLLAPRLQSALQRFAKPWWKRRAVRIFRDESSLSANPHLWSSITEALDSSSWFVLLLSPEAAASEWVNQEIEHWKTNHDPSRILPVLTAGELAWEGSDTVGSSVPAALRGAFTEEPRWVDLRFARNEAHLDLKNPSFSAAVADIASALRGVPKDELESEEVRQHRRTIRTAWGGVGLIGVLALAAVSFGVQSANNAAEAAENAAAAEANAAAEALARSEADDNAAEADRQRLDAVEARVEAEDAARLARSRELAASAVEVLDDDPTLATLLALEALRTFGDDPPGFLIDTLWRAAQSDHLSAVLRPGSEQHAALALSPDGSRLAASDDGGSVAMYAVPAGELMWSSQVSDTDPPVEISFHPDGGSIAVSIADSDSEVFGKGGPTDLEPSRIMMLDAADGSELARIDYPDCLGVVSFGWSPDAAVHVVASSFDGCEREGTSGDWVEVLDGVTFDPIALIDMPASSGGFGPLSLSFTSTGELFVFADAGEPVRVLSPPRYDTVRVVPGVDGIGSVAPSGDAVLTFSNERSSGLVLADARTGAPLDVLQIDTFPSYQSPVGFEQSGPRVAVATDGRFTDVFDTSTGKKVLRLPGGSGASPIFSPDGRWLYTPHRDGSVRIWDTQPQILGQTVVDQPRASDHVNARITIGPELGAASLVDFATFEFRIVFFDLDTGAFVEEIEGAGSAVPFADGRWLVDQEGEVIVWHPDTGRERTIAGCVTDDFVTCRESGEPFPDFGSYVSMDGTEIMLVDNETLTWQVISPDDGAVTETGTFPLLSNRRVYFTQDWVLNSTEQEHEVFDRASGESITTFTTPAGGIRAASSDGRTLAATGFGDVVFIDTEDWTVREYELEVDLTRGVGFSPDGSVLAVGDADRVVLVDVPTGGEFRSIPLAGASGFHWLADGRVLVGTSFPARWVSFSLDESTLPSEAWSGLVRGFTAFECERYSLDPCPTLEQLRGG